MNDSKFERWRPTVPGNLLLSRYVLIDLRGIQNISQSSVGVLPDSLHRLRNRADVHE